MTDIHKKLPKSGDLVKIKYLYGDKQEMREAEVIWWDSLQENYQILEWESVYQ